MAKSLDRNDYVTMRKPDLERRLHSAEDRLTRAGTMEAALSDQFAIQEISAVLAGEVTYFDYSNMGVGKGGPILRRGPKP